MFAEIQMQKTPHVISTLCRFPCISLQKQREEIITKNKLHRNFCFSFYLQKTLGEKGCFILFIYLFLKPAINSVTRIPFRPVYFMLEMVPSPALYFYRGLNTDHWIKSKEIYKDFQKSPLSVNYSIWSRSGVCNACLSSLSLCSRELPN